MAEAYLVVPQNPFFRATVASVPATYPATVATSTAPTTGVLGTAYQIGNRQIQLVPFATTATGSGWAMRLIGWSTYLSSGGTTFYVPSILANVTLATLQTGVNIEGTGDFNAFATITDASTTNPAISLKPDIYTVGTASAGPASLIVTTTGPSILQVQFISATAAPTMGVLFREI